MGSPNSPHTRQKFGSVLKLEKRDLSYADLHSEVMKNVSSEIKNNEELVKHMSKIPSYLERGESFQDKALNFGVLNWGSLERWHYDYNQMNDRSRRYSQSSSNTSSFFSTEGSSDRSTGDHSGPFASRKTRRPALQSHLNASPSEGNSSKFQDFRAVKSKTAKEFKRKDEDSRRSRSLEKSREISSLKGKMKIQEGEFTKEPVKLRDPETVVLLKPRDDPGNSRSADPGDIRFAESDCFDPKEIRGRKPKESRRRSFSEGSDPPERSSSSKKSISPPRSKILEEKKSTVMPTKSADTKARNPSPTRRLIMAMMGKSSNSKGRPESSACTDNSTNEKPNTNSRARSSPLRRLLDPLMKSKAVDSHQVLDPSKNGSRSSDVHSSSTVQALLQVAVKNGLPLFTFAVDNSDDVLAATLRSLCSSRKDENSRIYTFFNIHETKKKNGGWLNQRGKGYNYVPNVVAQMNVSDRFGGIREFVLFAVDLKPSDQQPSDQRSYDELAAIVVKILRKIDVPEFGASDLYSTMVILPNGVHGVPSKGEPSPLIERWTSGGLCDCGGWDLGCRVRVLGNRAQPSTESNLTEEAQHAGRYELFSQGEFLEDNRPIFSLSSFESGIFSVEFNSSLSLLQAFSICIAILDSRKPSDSTDFSEEKSSEKITLPENDPTKPVSSQVQVEGPTIYASNLPHSPAERV